MQCHECNKHIYLFKKIIPKVFILSKNEGVTQSLQYRPQVS
jgi:hypothetical protein